MPSNKDLESRLIASSLNADSFSSVNYLTFNQDGSSVALGLKNGFRVLSCHGDDSFSFQGWKSSSIGIIEMLFQSSLAVLVESGDNCGASPRKLKIINLKRQTAIGDLVFPSSVLLVRLCFSRLIVVLEDQIYIYNLFDMNLLHTIETSPNPNGLCATSSGLGDLNPSLLAYPSPPRTITHDSIIFSGVNTNGGSNSAQNNVQNVSNAPNRVGDAIIFDLNTLQPLAVIEAHKSALSSMALSSNGLLLATASDKGTIVRVFDAKAGTKLYQFRRGTYSTKIFSLRFSEQNKYLVATSSSETVHVFRLGSEELLSNQKKRKDLTDPPRGKNRASSFEIIREESDPDELNRLLRPSHLTPKRTERRNSEFDSDDADNCDLSDDSEASDIEDLVDPDDELLHDKGSDSNRATNSSSSPTFTSQPAETIESDSREEFDKTEPVVDQTRLSMARMIRRSSQKLGRKAAKKMGDFLPTQFSSILEPTRHFASLKVNSSSREVFSVAFMHESSTTRIQSSNIGDANSISSSVLLERKATTKLCHLEVVTSEGYLYKYSLDPDRGGDCILLSQNYLLGG